MPIFLHEYGNSIKNFSAFDIHPERHDLLTAIFSPGTKYSQQARRANINSKVIITGSSKLDFYSWKEIVKPPTKNPFFVYCNTVAHTQISSSGISQPKKWVPILEKSLKKLGYELVIKLHPHSYFLYRDEAWSKYVYCSPFSADLFRQASGIIADPSSILLEALTLNKPIFLTKNFENVSTYYDFLKQKIPILDYNTDFNSQIIRKYTLKKATTRKKKIWLDKWWYRLDGRSSERIWSNISKMV